MKKVIVNFDLRGKVIDVKPFGAGHINDTFVSRVETDRGVVRYTHQRINDNVFKKPEWVMENIERVTAHLRKKIIAAGGDPQRETLNLVRTPDGAAFYKDPAGNYWRTYLFVEGVQTYEVVESLDHIYNASRAFGRFQKMVSDLPANQLHETIANFHNTKWRFECFAEALEKDVENRAADAKAEIDFVLQRQGEAGVLVDLLAASEVSVRTTHNDTKFNNVLIDDRTGEGICVIDLDTVMPGLAMYDFGDSVRIGANPGAEDEKDLTRVRMDIEMFDSLARGYLDEAKDFLTPAEIGTLAFSAKLMTFECGMRFLADHLAGDIYFKVHRPGHNLDRCRTQFKMVKDMEDQADEMEAIIRKYS